MKGLAPKASLLFEAVSQMESIKPFVLVGGTALSLQIGNRLSEDLDFMRWKSGKKDDLDIGWHKIKKELETIGKVENVDVLGFDQALFVVDGVKLSFYAAPRKRIPSMQEITLLNNLRVSDIQSIGAMKMETMSRRSKFRDYYDVYSILKEGVKFEDMVLAAVEHSDHTLKEKNLLAILSAGDRFREERDFKSLLPIYDVRASDIQKYIQGEIAKMSYKSMDVDTMLSKTASIYKTKNGSMMLRAAIGDYSFNQPLSSEELKAVHADPKKLSTLAITKFHDKAVEYQAANKQGRSL